MSNQTKSTIANIIKFVVTVLSSVATVFGLQSCSAM